MAWSNSRAFRAFLADVLDNTAPIDLGSDAFKIALYDDSITPNQDVAAAASAYGAGVWATGGGPTAGSGPQRFEAGQWNQGGQPLTSVLLNTGTSGVVFWDAADTVSGSAADLSNVVGGLIYDDFVSAPVADQGICYVYFGGANSVVNGTFSVIYPSAGIMRVSM